MCGELDLRTREADGRAPARGGAPPPELGGKIATGPATLSEKDGRRARNCPCGTQLPGAGNNALKDQRRATENVFEEMLAGHSRPSKRTEAERRDSNLSEIAALNYQDSRATPYPQGVILRTANVPGFSSAGRANARRRLLQTGVRQTRDLDRLEIENDNFGATEETETRGQPALHADAARDQEVPCRRQREESTGAPAARDP